MKKLIGLVVLSLFLSEGIVAQSRVSSQTGPKPVSTKAKFRLSLDFISTGSGIDNESYEKIEKFIKDHPKKPVYEVKQKGKEGEKVINMKLSELTKDEQTEFISEVKKMIVKPELVRISENGVLQKKGANVAQMNNSLSVNCRINISFISQGNGIDRKSFEKIKEYIDKHVKKPAILEQKWGREGEVDYCLTLKELTPEEQKVFVNDIKSLVVNKEMVLISENQEYVKKGR